MIGRFFASVISTARDGLAGLLVRGGVTPNTLTLTGMLMTAGAGVCYAIGGARAFAWTLDPYAPANAYLLAAGGLMLLASACDMLDGAAARIGGRGSRFGAFLDSTLDRTSDFSVYAGLAVGYAFAAPANVTFVLLAMLAFLHSFMISYTKARAEDLIDDCTVGYWQRGERSAAILIATFACNTPSLLVQQATLPALTVWRRIAHTRAVLEGRPTVTDVRQTGPWMKLRLWRWPRMTLPYDLVTGVNIAWLIFARLEPTDVLRNLLTS